ncbi:MAG: hypothetical protein AAFR22_06160 [Chloroflexota bacterium]
MDTRKLSQNLIVLLISVLLMVVLLEVLLRVADPLGIDSHFLSIRKMGALMEPDPREYALEPGTHDFGVWSATIDANRNRVLPDETESDCVIAVLGDSVAFGQGVDDSAVWLNVLAPESDAQFVNVAMPGYNFPQLELSFDAVEADGYVYMVVGNDADRTPPFQFAPEVVFNPEGSSIFDYIGWLQYNMRFEWLRAVYVYSGTLVRNANAGDGISPNDDYDAFLDVLGTIADAENTMVVAFEDDFLTERAMSRDPDLVTIPRWTQVISWIDSHPNADGHAEMADALRTPLLEFADTVCEES